MGLSRTRKRMKNEISRGVEATAAQHVSDLATDEMQTVRDLADDDAMGESAGMNKLRSRRPGLVEERNCALRDLL